MPTPNMSDEELDSLFQRGAEAYPDDNYLAAWERMETKLNVATKAQALRQKVRRLFAAEIIVLSLLLWQGYEFTRSVTATNPQHTTTTLQPNRAGRSLASRATAVAPVASQNIASGSAATAYTAEAVGSAEAPELPVRQSQQLVGQKEGVGNAVVIPAPLASAGSAASRVAPGHGALHIEGLASSQRRHTTVSKPGSYVLEAAARYAYPAANRKASRATKVKAENTIASTSAAKFSVVSSSISALRDNAVDSMLPRNAAITSDALGLPLPDAPTLLAMHRPTDSATTEKRPAVRPAYRVVIGVLGAPAASAVRTAQSARIGGDVGLTVEYRFTNRLRVRTGLISSQKRYEAPSTDYTVPAAWQWFKADYEVDGSCRITEIPIDLRYDVLSRPAYQVFASVGVNSLFMRDERYSYDWMQNGQTFTKEAHVVDGSHHILSVLNFSAGVERKLGARWSGQVEPFLQLPLGGVGAGQVKLSSLGAAFSLKFGLFR